MHPGLTLFVLVPPLWLAGCGPVAPLDMAVSAATGRNCSVVSLNQGQGYCRPKEKPPEEPLFCTRSLGVPDCWKDPSKVPNNPREIADGPRALTAEQEKQRTTRLPGL